MWKDEILAAFEAPSPMCLVSEENRKNSVRGADLGAEVGTSQIRITNLPALRRSPVTGVAV